MHRIPIIAAILTLSASAAVTLSPDTPDIDPSTVDNPAAEALELFQDGRFAAALEQARPLAEDGNADALFLLGVAAETGQGTPPSRQEALDYYRRAAEKKHPDATFRRAALLFQSDRPEDRGNAADLLREAAKKSPGRAGRMLGEAHLNGLLTEEPDFDGTVKWWKRAAESGDVDSMMLLGRLYRGEFGFESRVDAEAALNQYQKAAEFGAEAAYVPLGSLLLNGPEDLRDEDEGLKWIERAADAGQPTAFLVLGDYRQNRLDDPQAAREAYAQGAEAGQADCMLRLAMMLDSGEAESGDPEAAADWLGKAAEAGNATAHFELALRISRQDDPDRNALHEHLVSAARGGLVRAQHELGLYYLSGQLGGQDPTAAVAWLTPAARAGLPDAQFHLANLYEQGVGVSQNINNAGELYSLATNQGHPQATTALARLHATGSGTERDPATAWALASLAVERGDEQAKSILGELSTHLTPESLAEAKEKLESLKNPTPDEGEAGEETEQ